MKFYSYEVPVAYSMVALAQRALIEQVQPFQKYICYWTAFNSIYITIADHKGQRVQPRIRRGIPATRNVGGVTIPEVDVLKEKRQIQMAIEEFDDQLKHNLIIHPGMAFFVMRTPYWKGIRIEYDSSGQRLNGVINVGKTIDERRPFWSPIDTTLYNKYLQNKNYEPAREALCEQIVDILYTIRNNTLHGGKRADDANDHNVIEQAFPLLKMIVDHFFY